jgi:DNA-directed RNA polymerase subunit K/omega
MIQLPEGFDSVFRYIVVVSQRAEQLINGAKPRCDSAHAKKTLVAKNDVDDQLVSWRILTQEELDAQRQAIVEQFRAEVDSVTDLQAKPAYEDVLPTAAENGTPAEEAPAVEQDEERDDEVSRLQKLLGMVGGAAGIGAPAAAGDEQAEADEEVEEVSLELADLDGENLEDEEEDEEG